MSLLNDLQARANNQCELCSSTEDLLPQIIEPRSSENLDDNILACGTCRSQITKESDMDANHWRCLNDSIWSEYDGVKVVAWRMLNRIKNEGWPVDLLEMIYLEDAAINWAKESGDHLSEDEKIIHRDAVGTILNSGDSVTVIKDLKVKGSSMVAKQGTAVRNISLDHDNANYIEGKVDGQNIVILTQYIKKNK
ncbi:PhnA domain-containing protein [Flavobacteriales bacterium]|jgi:protein PhnA|nr:PhnA domain-containing protein [Flavobacteriales bacterium]